MVEYDNVPSSLLHLKAQFRVEIILAETGLQQLYFNTCGDLKRMEK